MDIDGLWIFECDVFFLLQSVLLVRMVMAAVRYVTV